MMDPVSREKLDEITKLSAKELAMEDNADKLGFLVARRAYLRPEQVAVFKELLKGAKPLSEKDQANFVKEHGKAVAKAKKDADAQAKQTKSVKESQNPNND